MSDTCVRTSLTECGALDGRAGCHGACRYPFSLAKAPLCGRRPCKAERVRPELRAERAPGPSCLSLRHRTLLAHARANRVSTEAGEHRCARARRRGRFQVRASSASSLGGSGPSAEVDGTRAFAGFQPPQVRFGLLWRKQLATIGRIGRRSKIRHVVGVRLHDRTARRGRRGGAGHARKLSSLRADRLGAQPFLSVPEAHPRGAPESSPYSAAAARRSISSVSSGLPSDLMFQLSAEEDAALRIQFGTSKTGRGPRRPPLRLHGTRGAMLSAVLRIPRAIQVSIEIVRAFVRLRQLHTCDERRSRKAPRHAGEEVRREVQRHSGLTPLTTSCLAMEISNTRPSTSTGPGTGERARSCRRSRARRFSIEPELLPLLRDLFNRAGGKGPILDLLSEPEMAVGLRRRLAKAGAAAPSSTRRRRRPSSSRDTISAQRA